MGFRVKMRKGTRSGEKSSGRGSVPAWPWAEEAKCRGASSGPLPSASQPDFRCETTCRNPSAALDALSRRDHLQDAFQFKSKTLDRQYMHTGWGFSETKHSVL